MNYVKFHAEGHIQYDDIHKNNAIKILIGTSKSVIYILENKSFQFGFNFIDTI